MLPYPVYIWDGALGEWVDHGNLRGVGIRKIEQISYSLDSLGVNVIRVTLDDGSFYDYTVRNGDRGPAGSIWIGTSAPPDDSYSIWLNPSGMVSGFVGANQGAENAGRVLAVGEDGVVIPREETPYTLPNASPDALGGVKADAAETADTQPVRIGTDGKLYTAPGGDTSIGITGASAGQIPKVKAVDESGAPTEWKAEKDTTPFIVTVGGDEYSGYTSSHTFDEIAAAASAGRVVMAYTDYINFPQVGTSLYGVYFDLDSTQDVAIFVYIDPWNMIKYTFAVDPSSISASASYLSATSSTFGGVKADSAESTDTQPVRIGEDGKLYTAPGGGGADISLGISGATAGKVAKVKAVDASGAPTAWEAGDAASGGGTNGEKIVEIANGVDVSTVSSFSYSTDMDGNQLKANRFSIMLNAPNATKDDAWVEMTVNGIIVLRMFYYKNKKINLRTIIHPTYCEHILYLSAINGLNGAYIGSNEQQYGVVRFVGAINQDLTKAEKTIILKYNHGINDPTWGDNAKLWMWGE